MTASKTMGCLLIALFALLLVPASASAQGVPITEQAKLHFGVGVGLLEDPAGPRYGEAYESFRRAYKASPSPKILSNLGLCAMHIERDGEAIEAYQLYLNQVDNIAPDERARIDSDLKRLRASSGTLVLNVRPAGALIVDERIPESGESVINRYQFTDSTVQLRLRSGKHKIRLEAKGHKPQILAIEVAPGDSQVRKIKLVEIKDPKKKKKPKKQDPVSKAGPEPNPKPTPEHTIVDEGGGISGASIAMIAVTGALTVGAVVVGVLALQSKADYEAYDNGGKREEAEAIRSNGEALNITTDVLIALAAASGVVTVVLLATTSGSGESAALTVSPTVGGGMMGLDVRF
jgi:hypothetical protein